MLKLVKLRTFHKKKKKQAQKFNHISSNTIYSWKMILFSSTIWLIICTKSVYGIQSGRLMAPNSIIALSGDVHVQLQLHQNNNYNNPVNKKQINNSTENVQISNLVISKFIERPKNFSHLHTRERTYGVVLNDEINTLQHGKKLILKNIPVYPDPRHNVTQVTVPCETFAMAGKYEMQFVTNLKTINSSNNNNSSSDTTFMPLSDERLQQTLDVRWPQAEITLSHTRLSTYPDTSVKVTLRFPQVNCKRKPDLPEQLAEFLLELMYCGKDSSCSTLLSANFSKSSIFWSEKIHGFIKEKNFQLNCELFGLAGIYAVQLRPWQPDLMLNFPLTRRYINVDWSEKFVFNVFARSIFPCDPHTGIGVLFEYPRCILEQGDRVRVFAKLRADVASLKPPTSLHYVAEQRVIKNQYSLYFSCDLFTEKFVEYCFVYVSQGVSGAVADVRMDCVPTLPVSDSDTGEWGPWSEWTPCSTNCLGGTRNRYRFCDSPPPRYGAKFCDGPSVQTEKCGGRANSDSWNCIYESNFADIDYNNQNKVSQTMGPGCRCGCIVHIGSSKSKRLVAGALQSCPGKSFWLIQADTRKNITLSFRFLRLPCASQYIKVRDGPSLSSTLILEVQGNEYVHLPNIINSTGAQLLIEIYAGDQITSFAKELNQSNTNADNNNLLTLHCNGGFSLQVQEISVNKTNTVLATTKELFRSRDIKRIIRRSGLSIVHIIVMIFASIIILISTILGIQFILRYQKYHLALAQNSEDGLCLHPPPPAGSSNSLNMLTSRAVSTTTLISEVICLVKLRSKPLVRHSILRESLDVDCIIKSQCSKGKDEQINKDDDTSNAIDITNLNEKELDKDEISSCSKSTLSPTSITEEASSDQYVVVGVRQKRKIKLSERRLSHDVESSIDSNSMNTPCNSPTTISPRFANLKADCCDKMTVKMLRAHFDELVLDSGSVASKLSTRPSTASSMTNGQYSPLAGCIVSTAAIRSTNLKENKEKQNRKKLLSRPNSDMSIGGNQDTELEMDYYDYDVINAAAAPGSYFSMDPAHLIWIPPFENENNLDDMDIILQRRTPAESVSSIELNKTEKFYKEMKINKYRHFCWPQTNDSDDGSITPTNLINYTPSSFELLSSKHASNKSMKAVSPSEANNFKNTLIQQTICAEQLSLNNSIKEHTKSTRSLCNINTNNTLLRQQEQNLLFEDLGKSARDVNAYRAGHHHHNNNDLNHHFDGNYMEKETSVVKSQSDLQQYLAIDDIQFADDSESDYENYHNIGKA